MIYTLGLSLAIAFTSFVGFASAEPNVIYQYNNIPVLRNHVLTIDDLEARSVIPSEIANQQRQFYAVQASKIRGESVTVTNLRNWNRFKALFRVQTIAKVLAVIVSIIGALFFLGGVLSRISWMIIAIVKELLAKIPIPVYEVIFCVAGAYLMLFLEGLSPNLFGALIFFLSLLLFHGKKTCDLSLDSEIKADFVSGMCLVIYAGSAWWNQSIAVAVLASLAFIAFFGFKLIAGPLSLLIGFDSEDKAGQGTFAAGCLMSFGIILTQNYLPSSIDVFQTGALFAGTFVYFLGMTILSSKWVASKNYWLRNVITFVSGLAMIWAATSLELGMVNAIAGTFFVLFIMDKYVELCTLWVKDEISFGASLLGAGLAGFGLIRVIELHPQYFIFHLFS
ncbi:hypothetical protein [Mastigocoleus testarum]|uniref:hypothetical protein n=1 Tax=Mastigocoleus testarum TaxID=996925 RepID=UPI00128EC038|nr:hypothetical protein [Mastigocoleus testarum]